MAEKEWEGKKKAFLDFGAAMQTAEVYINGFKMTRHKGGYQKFGIRDDNNEVHWVWATNVTVNIENSKVVNDLRHDYSEGTKYMTSSEINEFIDNEINSLKA